MRGSQTKLIDTFLKLGYISRDALKTLKGRGGVPAVEAALLSGILDPDAKGWLLAEALGIPFQEIDPAAVSLQLSEILPEEIARENMLAPVFREEGRITLAVADPFRHKAFSEIERLTGESIRLVICPLRTITRIIDRFYPAIVSISPEDVEGGAISREEAQEWLVKGRPRKVAEKILLHAANTGISSVRVSPSGKSVVITGSRGEGKTVLLGFPLRYRGPITAAFSELAGLPANPDVVEETTFQLETEAGIHAFRISCLLGLSGPEAIIKVLPDLKAAITLTTVGFHPEQLEITRRVMSKRDGVYLVSSPGAEGVSTTLFAMLRESFRSGSRVVTIEEAHRFRNDGYIQLERRNVLERFAGDWVRLAESLEPDALMIERVSDPAELLDLIHLARKGIPLFCGMRAFNFRRTLRTLLSLEVDPFVLARVARLVMHQRLVDLLCPECRRPVPAVPSLQQVGERHRQRFEAIIRGTSFYLHAGCAKCAGTGYSGKMALFEVLPFTPGVQNQVVADAPVEERLERIVEESLHSALPSVEDLLKRGMVTFDDIVPFFR